MKTRTDKLTEEYEKYIRTGNYRVSTLYGQVFYNLNNNNDAPKNHPYMMIFENGKFYSAHHNTRKLNPSYIDRRQEKIEFETSEGHEIKIKNNYDKFNNLLSTDIDFQTKSDFTKDEFEQTLEDNHLDKHNPVKWFKSKLFVLTHGRLKEGK